MFDRKFTKSLIIRDFDDVLKDPFRHVHLFLYYTHYTVLQKFFLKYTNDEYDHFLLHPLLSKKNSENRHARPVTEGQKLRFNTPY